MTKKTTIKSALTVSNIFWPDFRIVKDLVFFSLTAPENVDISRWHDKTEIEVFYNHLHVLDIFSNHASLKKEPFWNARHSDFKAACEFGKKWTHAVFSKLIQEYPSRQFRVYYTENDNPIIRFHQKHENEQFWLMEENLRKKIISGKVIVLDTDRSHNEARKRPR